ncbi:MAG: hypothetical protein ABID79_04980 [Elusimicrobiota bacterium]
MIKKYFKLFSISFVALFLQIACIRWFNSNIVMLSYFSNFVLLACFLGLGAGILLAPKKTNFIILFPSIFLILCVIFWKVIIRLTINSDISVYFTASGFAKGVPLYNASAWWFLPIVFIFTTVMFVSIGQEVGRAFSGIKPLAAYIVNICGSIFGVGLFTAISFFNSSPFLWFAIAFLCLLPTLFRKQFFYFNILIVVLSSLFILMISQGAVFSPYYRIDAISNVVIVNGIPHQTILNIDKEFANSYKFPYELVKNPKKVLILGAGTGNDVAVALSNGAEKIDAVEIDPVIVEIGKQHPNKPYQNKKVKIFNDDARAFLKKSDERYDLVVFALIDSLTVFSQFSSVRLENFVFTKDAFEDVQKHLTDDGVVVIYNQFRKVWIVERLSKMLEETFDKKTIIYNEQEKEQFAVLFNGPGIEKINFPKEAELFSNQKTPLFSTSNYQIKSTTDNWPFLYLEKPAIPMHYIIAIFVILFFAGLLVFISSNTSYNINNHFFFLGCGFMILETSAIIRMAMLFGSTWIVNSIVIMAVLVMSLFSAYVTSRFSPNNNKKFYIYLFLMIILNILIPLKTFLIFPYYPKIVLSSLLLFLPIYFSGVIFATSFSKSENSLSALGSNLIGAMFGGCLEYISLKYGYSSLMFLLLGIYLVSIKNFKWKFK